MLFKIKNGETTYKYKYLTSASAKKWKKKKKKSQPGHPRDNLKKYWLNIVENKKMISKQIKITFNVVK